MSAIEAKESKEELLKAIDEGMRVYDDFDKGRLSQRYLNMRKALKVIEKILDDCPTHVLTENRLD